MFSNLDNAQAELFCEIANRMVTGNATSFMTIGDGNNIRISFIPHNQPSLVISRTEDGNIWALREFFDNMEKEGSGRYRATRTRRTTDLFDQMVRRKILLHLKQIRDQQPYQYKDVRVSYEQLGISYDVFQANADALIRDGSMAEGQKEITGTWQRLYITDKGEQRLAAEVFDLKQDPYPAITLAASQTRTNPLTTLPDEDFSFMRSAKLRRVAIRDYAELRTVAAVTAPKSTMLLCGAIVEAVLADKIRLRWKTRAQQIADLFYGTSGATKPPKPLLSWQLDKLISVAVGLKLLTPSASIDTSAIQAYRNLVHPLREVREDSEVNQATAGIMLNLLQLVLQHLTTKKR